MSKKKEPRILRRKDGTTSLSWGPASGTYRKFEKGNEVRLRHGARSERHVTPVAEELVAGLLEDRPDLAQYPEALEAWARAEARALLMAGADFLDEDGHPINPRDVARFERLAADARARLGLDPKSEADLHKSRADAARSVVDLDAIRRRGREALEGRDGA